MGLHDLYEFDLVPIEAGATIVSARWLAAQHLLLHTQPALEARLVGDPPDRIRVLGYGGTEVAPGLLDRISRLVGTALRVERELR